MIFEQQALLPTKPSSDDDAGFRHGFRVETSLLLTQSTPPVHHDTIRRCWIGVILWDCKIYANVVRTLSRKTFMYSPLVL